MGDTELETRQVYLIQTDGPGGLENTEVNPSSIMPEGPAASSSRLRGLMFYASKKQPKAIEYRFKLDTL